MWKFILKFAKWYVNSRDKENTCKDFRINYSEDLFPLIGVTEIQEQEDLFYEQK